jgi:hypothetical protein
MSTRTVRIAWPTPEAQSAYAHLDVEVPHQPGSGGKLVPTWVDEKWAIKKVQDTQGFTPVWIDLEVIG